MPREDLDRQRLLVVGLSARTMAEGVVAAGFRADAADCFGDADTLAVVERWHGCAADDGLALAPARLLAVLAELAREGGFRGWIAGSGFEGRHDLLAQGAALLPLLGNGAAVVRPVRTPAIFYGRLAALGIAHPPSRVDPPQVPGWLSKDAWSSGGWQVRRHDPRCPPAAVGDGRYFQRERPGVPMSVLFVADGRRARVLGFTRQLVRALGRRPMVHRGCIGPLPVADGVAQELAAMADVLTAEFGLQGLNGVDFLLDGDAVAVLELNPRPVGSIAVLGAELDGGAMGAHIAAVTAGRLPPATRSSSAVVRGCETLFARRRLRLGAELAERMAALPWCHDRPAVGTMFAWGDPVCSVSAAGADAEAVEHALRCRRRTLMDLMEQ